ncbi:MAG: hypothetical protein EAZ26_10665, partial [Runella slithyformis]
AVVLVFFCASTIWQSSKGKAKQVNSFVMVNEGFEVDKNKETLLKINTLSKVLRNNSSNGSTFARERGLM